MKYSDAFMQAAREVDDRNKKYGNVDECFSRIAKLASAFFNREVTEYEIAMILHLVKLGRIGDNKSYADNYVDGISYMAFAAQFATNEEDGGLIAFRSTIDQMVGASDFSPRSIQKIPTRPVKAHAVNEDRDAASDVG